MMNPLTDGLRMVAGVLLMALVLGGVVFGYAAANAGPECPVCHHDTVMDHGLAECFRCNIRVALDKNGKCVYK